MALQHALVVRAVHGVAAQLCCLMQLHQVIESIPPVMKSIFTLQWPVNEVSAHRESLKIIFVPRCTHNTRHGVYTSYDDFYYQFIDPVINKLPYRIKF